MDVIGYEKRGHIVVVTMNRPERLNALGKDMVIGLADAWTEFQNDDDAWIGILTGVGRGFCVGMDIRERAESGQSGLGIDPAAERDPYWKDRMIKMTIAAVNGLAYGGGYFLTARSPIRVAAASARFQISEIFRGGLGDFRLVGRAGLGSGVAAELALGGTLTAQRLYEVGFLNRVVPDGALLASAMEMAEKLLEVPPLALQSSAILMQRTRNNAPQEELEKIRAEWSEKIRTSEDAKESLKSFIEKRKPVYKAR